MAPAIRIDNISKLYRVGVREKGYKTLREAIADACWSPVERIRQSFAPQDATNGKGGRLVGENFWALKDVSFEVQPGEVVGIIGRNGAGKSTLLKILSRITEPTGGRVELRGRVGSLLEVGTGFHPELTGRDNVYMNGSILGMTRREIARKFDEIVDFSGIEDFIDTPVKRYSSGMSVRLAFAVAAHLEPEILIVDEVLAVGDMSFQRKCLKKMDDVAKHGRTILFVSHNLLAISRLCPNSVLLDGGRVSSIGATDDVLSDYRRTSANLLQEYAAMECHGKDIIDQVTLGDEESRPLVEMAVGAPLTICLTFRSKQDIHDPRIAVDIFDEMGQRYLTIQNPIAKDAFLIPQGRSELECTVDCCPLAPGCYQLHVVLLRGNDVLDRTSTPYCFEVANANMFESGRTFAGGFCVAPSQWRALCDSDPTLTRCY